MFNEDQLAELYENLSGAMSTWTKETGADVGWDLSTAWDDEKGVLSYKLDIFV